ncbi:MAG: diguanylate cyclase [Acaryochloridaceae cyanobacterium RU_4_10]|nr:diguanylate cyclase [Acaryochloridaceae cyanobacterium RU_4_10]
MNTLVQKQTQENIIVNTDCSFDGVILIVDDNPTNLSVLSIALKGAGYKTRVAMDGVSAIEQVQEDPPALILLDVQMPGINGFETCMKLKANPVTQDIPVIFITASVDLDQKVKGLSVGAVDYITKPFQQEEVLARVKVHLELRFLTKKVQEQAIALREANQELHRLANLDGLTAVANRRRFDEYLDQEWRRSQREQNSLALILCDIDYFKNYNDYYGHQAGDVCLKRVAQAIDDCLKRPADLVTRYGGEEFAIILPNTSSEGAVHVAQLIQTTIRQLSIPHHHSLVSSFVTLSLGVSSQVPNAELDAHALVATTDKALYISKAEGRNTYHLEC